MRDVGRARSFAVTYLRLRSRSRTSTTRGSTTPPGTPGCAGGARRRPRDSFAEWTVRAAALPPDRIAAEVGALDRQPRTAFTAYGIDPATAPALGAAARIAGGWLTSSDVSDDAKLAVLAWLPSLPGDPGPLASIVRGLAQDTDAAREEPRPRPGRAYGSLAAGSSETLAGALANPAGPRDARPAALEALLAGNMTQREATAALRKQRHLRSSRALRLDDGKPITRQGAWSRVRYAAHRANVPTGVHILRHTFCSHLVMRGAAMRAVQELVGHQDLTMTQRYSHLSPAALVDTIRLLESRVADLGVEKYWRRPKGRDRKLKSLERVKWLGGRDSNPDKRSQSAAVLPLNDLPRSRRKLPLYSPA